MQEVISYPNCFVCGGQNQHGLKATFQYDGKEASTSIIADRSFEGYKGIFHGGIISTLLDEVMIKAILAENVYAVTAELTIKFKKPVSVGQKLSFCGRVSKRRGRLFFTTGSVTSSEGILFATASGKYIEAREELKENLLSSLTSDADS